MACEIDYAALNFAQRRDALLKEAKDGGVDIHKAISVGALSGNECGFIWNQKRAKLLFDESECWQCRTCVGFEFAIKPNSGGQHILARSNREAAATRYVLEQGLATVGADGDLFPTPKLTTPANNDNIARWLEFVIINRRPDLLTNFSVGPTQMWLFNSALTIGQPGRGPNVDPRWLNTWEQIFDFYMAHSGLARLKAITYLEPAFNGVRAWPSQAPEDRDLGIAWLTPRQLGNKAAATSYYDRIYRAHLIATVARARELKLI